MQYQFAREAKDYSHFASGRVFHSLPGHPAFPVRLASEIFQRCVSLRGRLYNKRNLCTLYDPCCGVGYTISILAFLHRGEIGKILASDVDEKAVEITRRNLELAEPAGMEDRIDEIARMAELYGKESHREALRSAQILKNELDTGFPKRTLETRVFRASALEGKEMLKYILPRSVDIVITDIPYGDHSDWVGAGSVEPLWAMLDGLRPALSPTSIVAVASGKKQKATHPAYQRVEQFQVGKRRVAILRLLDR